MSVKSSKAKAWKWFSIMIRLRDADEHGYVTCITCTHRDHWRKFDAGHYLPKGSNKGVEFNETNVHAQCGRCNCFMEGNRLRYREEIIRRYGQKHEEQLHIFGKMDSKKSITVWESMAKEYKRIAEEIARSKNIRIDDPIPDSTIHDLVVFPSDKDDYLEDVVVKILSDETGNDPESIHEFIKLKFNPKFVTVGNEQALIGGSTANLSTKDFEEKMEEIRAWAAIELNINIPEPNEVSYE